MGFWNVVKIKTEELSKKTAQNTSKFVEKTKNSIAITELEDNLKNLYAAIGEQLYVANKTDASVPDFTEYFSKISEYKAQIDALNEENERLKNN